MLLLGSEGFCPLPTVGVLFSRPARGVKRLCRDPRRGLTPRTGLLLFLPGGRGASGRLEGRAGGRSAVCVGRSRSPLVLETQRSVTQRVKRPPDGRLRVSIRGAAQTRNRAITTRGYGQNRARWVGRMQVQPPIGETTVRGAGRQDAAPRWDRSRSCCKPL